MTNEGICREEEGNYGRKYCQTPDIIIMYQVGFYDGIKSEPAVVGAVLHTGGMQWSQRRGAW